MTEATIDEIKSIAARHIEENAYATPQDALDHTRAELVAIGARIRDLPNLHNRIKFLTMIAEKITFIRVLYNEGVILTLHPGDKFTSNPKVLRDEVRDWIIAHRSEIIAELKAEGQK